MSEEESSSSTEQESKSDDIEPMFCGMPFSEFLHRVNLNWEERIAPRIWKSPEGCLLWNGSHSMDGYGVMRIAANPHVRMHMLAYVFYTKTPIPKGMEVCHTCDAPDCINPQHLFLGTKSENMQDMIAKGRKAKNYYSKLTTQQIIDIKNHLEARRYTQMQLAKMYFVGQATISEIKNDRRPIFASAENIRKASR